MALPFVYPLSWVSCLFPVRTISTYKCCMSQYKGIKAYLTVSYAEDDVDPTVHWPQFSFSISPGILAERLRREIRNLLGFPRVGSNPADVAIFSFSLNLIFFWFTKPAWFPQSYDLTKANSSSSPKSSLTTDLRFRTHALLLRQMAGYPEQAPGSLRIAPDTLI
ncbi:hypothetical protein B0I71DRAFT_142577 [Yarrowia lipolytica]|uniref:Uncharacterized protein n=1 Tax=Yarrowia lipolytica TaxID=4952 RepID=A0A371C158_YARLL|nr:hypothetical protein B0I71DRAFT_142577 [Yarrowia lipolytica]